MGPGSTHCLIHTVDRVGQRIKKKPLLLQLEQFLLYLRKVGRRIIEPGGVAPNELGKVLGRGKRIHGWAEDGCGSNTCLYGTRTEDHVGNYLMILKQTSKNAG